MHQGWLSHILSMPSIKQLYTLETPIDNAGNIHKTSPSKEDGKYLTSRTSILSKSIVVRLDFINFKASITLKRKKNEER